MQWSRLESSSVLAQEYLRITTLASYLHVQKHGTQNASEVAIMKKKKPLIVFPFPWKTECYLISTLFPKIDIIDAEYLIFLLKCTSCYSPSVMYTELYLIVNVWKQWGAHVPFGESTNEEQVQFVFNLLIEKVNDDIK